MMMANSGVAMSANVSNKNNVSAPFYTLSKRDSINRGNHQPKYKVAKTLIMPPLESAITVYQNFHNLNKLTSYQTMANNKTNRDRFVFFNLS
jgi:hypothetical protein